VGKAYLVYRPCPYDDFNFIDNLSPKDDGLPSLLSMQDLDSHDIDDDVIANKSLSLSKNGRPSLFLVYPGGSLMSASQGKAFCIPEYDYEALSKYGYNHMQVELESFSIYGKSFGSPGDANNILTLFQKKLASWHKISDKILTGTFSIAGDETMRIGQKLNYNRTENGRIEEDFEEGDYYITGVNHQYVYAQNFVTTLTVDRGISIKMKKDIIDSAQKNTIYDKRNANIFNPLAGGLI
jgi:hypothetical protein